MAVETAAGMAPVMGFALVGALGVGAQWAAWRLNMPAIVLMLLAGLAVGPGLGIFDPARDIGPLMQPMISIAVAIILFEGGLTLNRESLRGAAEGVKRLVFIGAPLGWAGSAAALHYLAGLSWPAAAVFGGIMIVTGPTVIAPLLRQARLKKRPAQLLQWEAIINDPIGALAAVLAFELVLVMQAAETAGDAAWDMISGIILATVMGIAAGWAISAAFRQGRVPEYMKVPVLFAVLLGVFALSDHVLHESGLLAVTVMGIWIANADLPSYTELRRFKEHATVLLVSGVFILLAASMNLESLSRLTWQSAIWVVAVVLVVRPLTVMIALIATQVPWRERLLVAFTGPRGVVLVAVAGLFGERLAATGIEDGKLLTPLAFALVAATVVLHGFSLRPMARMLGLASSGAPGVIIVGGSQFSAALGKALQDQSVPVLVADANRSRLRGAREAEVPVFYGDILSEAAEHGVEIMNFGRVLALSDNEAYNTLVATDLAPEFGRDSVFQLKPSKQENKRHALPSTLGGRSFASGKSYYEISRHLTEGWAVGTTRLSDEFTLEHWVERNPEAIVLAIIGENEALRFLDEKSGLEAAAGDRLVWFGPKDAPGD